MIHLNNAASILLADLHSRRGSDNALIENTKTSADNLRYLSSFKHVFRYCLKIYLQRIFKEEKGN